MGDPLATVVMGQKWGLLLCPFPWGSLVPIEHNVAWAEAYLRTKCYPDPSYRLATIHMGRKVWAALPLSVWELDLHLKISPQP